MLLNSNLTVQEISQTVGFNDVKYFISVFKRITILTPSKYRELV
ncbi:helix-turn-helix domain-containing protein [Neobacillus niacini]